MRMTIVILMVLVAAVAKGFSADFNYKSDASNSAQSTQVTSDRIQTNNSKLNNDFTDVSDQVNNGRANESVNSTTEKTESSESDETEQAGSEMIASAMGIGIF